MNFLVYKLHTIFSSHMTTPNTSKVSETSSTREQEERDIRENGCINHRPSPAGFTNACLFVKQRALLVPGGHRAGAEAPPPPPRSTERSSQGLIGVTPVVISDTVQTQYFTLITASRSPSPRPTPGQRRSQHK